MDVVVIPDHRAPVVTHMVWYRNGSADDPPGKSGIAHFLEHLMFKGTKNHPQGEFSEVVSPNSAARRTRSPRTTTPPISSASPKEHLRVDDGVRGRPHDQSRPHRRGRRARARRGAGRAPHAHRHRSRLAAQRGRARRAVHASSLRQADHRLAARDRGARAARTRSPITSASTRRRTRSSSSRAM